MQELMDILEEEISIMEPENPSEESTKHEMDTALATIRNAGAAAKLTPLQKNAVKHALEDVGELYLFAGTSSGFDVESKSQEREHQSRGQKARTQAALLGIYL